MLIVETIARIRREHFIRGKTIKEIRQIKGMAKGQNLTVSHALLFWLRDPETGHREVKPILVPMRCSVVGCHM
jgi:hypothetical protein